MTAPSGLAQQRVIAAALVDAGIQPADVDVIEAHGTGTRLGDPIEAHALMEVFQGKRQNPLRLGSVKTNIGHAQAAAGVAGIATVLAAMRHERHPRMLHLANPTRSVAWDPDVVALAAEESPWPRSADRVRYAGVSSFGISGTNAHVVIGESPLTVEDDVSTEDTTPQEIRDAVIPLVLSGHHPRVIADRATQLLSLVDDRPGVVAQAARTLGSHRGVHRLRHALLVSTPDDLRTQLRSLAAGEPGFLHGSAKEQRVGFLFTGQGSQRLAMGCQLARRYDQMYQGMAEAIGHIDVQLDHSLWEAINPALASDDPAVLAQAAKVLSLPQHAGAAVFAVEIGLMRLLDSFGIVPDAVVGHSVGEYAAAHAAGALSLADAAMLVTARGRLMGELPAGGAMLSCAMTEDEARGAIDEFALPLCSIAAINGTRSVVLSGSEQSIDKMSRLLAGRGIHTQRLAVGHAYHSPLMEPMITDFRRIAQLAELREPSAASWISTVTGKEIASADLEADYWVRHILEPVRFLASLDAASRMEIGVWFELGPDAVLSGLAAAQSLRETLHLPCLRSGHDEVKQLLGAVLQAHVNGVEVKTDGLLAGTSQGTLALPPYPFQRRRYWVAPEQPVHKRPKQLAHALLGFAVRLLDQGGMVFSGRVSVASQPWLADHIVDGVVLMPGTGIVDLMLAAAEQCDLAGIVKLDLLAPMIIPERGSLEIQLLAGPPAGDGSRMVDCFSVPVDDENQRVLHATGVLGDVPAPSFEEFNWPPEGTREIDVSGNYEEAAKHGYQYGPSFRALRHGWIRGMDDKTEFFGEVDLGEVPSEQVDHVIHPILLDATMHASDAVLGLSNFSTIMVPVAWTGVCINGVAGRHLRFRITSAGVDALKIELASPDGLPLATVNQVDLQAVDGDTLRRASQQRVAHEPLLDLEWLSVPAAGVRSRGSIHMVAGGDDPQADLGTVLGETLEAMKEWLAQDREQRLTIVTTDATEPRSVEGLVQSAVWGLVRSAQVEYPDRFQLLDVDGHASSADLIESASRHEEPELRIRAGAFFAPRLQPQTHIDGHAEWPVDEQVLVTGGTGGIGQALLRHLAECGARRLVAVSRRGMSATGMDKLRVELAEFDAELTVLCGDLGEPNEVRRIVDAVLDAGPLGSIIHAAGVLDDRLLADIDDAGFERVLKAKALAAWHLHQVTTDLDLRRFVLFSSSAGILDGAGQATYAAANVFCDALAHLRRAQGLPATSILWGAWAGESGMAAGLDAKAIARMKRLGLVLTDFHTNLAAFDRAISSTSPAPVALCFDRAILHRNIDYLPSILQALVPAAGLVPTKQIAHESATGTDTKPLLTSGDREQVLTRIRTIVQSEAAAVLGLDNAQQVGLDRPLSEMGFDSLATVELRNRLVQSTGVKLSPTIVFDFPTCRDLASHLAEIIQPEIKVNPVPQAASELSAPKGLQKEDPVVVVGIGCRFPGGVENPDDLWKLVWDCEDAITAFPRDRGWAADLVNPDGGPGRSLTDQGGFLHDAALFDNDFFGISPREATAMDPQQRVLLETTWWALEDAGLDAKQLRGSDTAVFMGTMYHDWGLRLGEIPEEYAGYHGNGSIASMMSGKLSYLFGLEGPSMSIDTACSSSLVAIHLASAALQRGECSIALAGGVTVMSTPDTFIDMTRQGGLASDGRCKSYGADANGTGWGEGAGVLVLTRLSVARQRGLLVWGVVAGSAVNSDGASNGLTAPNGLAQQRVIKAALANAGLDINDVDLIEGHGTGTSLGDPIEAQALLDTYGRRRRGSAWLGSIKSNIGHTQAAAGVAGVIKVIQSIRHRAMPGSLYCAEPSTKVEWGSGSVRLLQKPREWEAASPRRGAVSSFGISGTNAHVIIEEPPADLAVTVPMPDARSQAFVPLPLSARSDQALRDLAKRLEPAARDLDTAALASALARRASHNERAVVWGLGDQDVASRLAQVAMVSDDARAVAGIVRGSAEEDVKHVWLFSGQGSQWRGMAADLRQQESTFSRSIQSRIHELPQVVEALAPVLGDLPHDAVAGMPLWQAVDCVMSAEGEQLPMDLGTWTTQVALFIYQLALGEQLLDWGLQPDLLIGHSIGEIAVAVLGGVMSPEAGLRLVVARGWLMGCCGGQGGMAVIKEDPAQVRTLLSDWGLGAVELAAINTPNMVSISGPKEDVLTAVARCGEVGVTALELDVSDGFHSSLMEPALEPLRAVVEGLQLRKAERPVASTVTGCIDSQAMAAPDYWVDQVRATVDFNGACRAALQMNAQVFLEVGPARVLAGLVPQIAGGDNQLTCVATGRRGAPTRPQLLQALAEMWVSGVEVDWDAVAGHAVPARAAGYAFQHRRFWLEGAPAKQGPESHPVLQSKVLLPDESTILGGSFGIEATPWVFDHVINGQVLVPGTAYVELALEAGRQCGLPFVEELTLTAPLRWAEGEQADIDVLVQVHRPEDDQRARVEVQSRQADGCWTKHAVGVLSNQKMGWVETSALSGVWPPPDATTVDITCSYEQLRARGYDYGPAFQGLVGAWIRDDMLYAEVQLPAGLSNVGYVIHPALLDIAMHGDLVHDFHEGGQQTLLPFAWTGVQVGTATSSRLRVAVKRFDGAADSAMAVADERGRPVLQVSRLVCRPEHGGTDPDLHEVCWQRVTSTVSASSTAVSVWKVPVETNPTDLVTTIAGILEKIQAHLLGDGLLVVCTQRSQRVLADDRVDPVAAAVWGLVRGAQAEHPGRLVLLDVDDIDQPLNLASLADLGEAELAVRDGVVMQPRLGALGVHDSVAFDPERSVLVTGGLTGLGAQLALRLVTGHGVRHLVLTGRRGTATPGCADLVTKLTTLGASVQVKACDVTDREAVASLVASSAPAVGAVLHAAANVGSSVVERLDRCALETALGAKALGAWNLHQVTKELELTHFVVISSVGALVLAEGQADYAAANAFCDGLALARRAAGLPGTSIAFGLWDVATGLGGDLTSADLARMRRMGLPAMSVERGLELFDMALASGAGHVGAFPIDRAALSRRAVVPALMTDMAAVPMRASTQDVSSAVPDQGRGEREVRAWIEQIVLQQVASIRGDGELDEALLDKAFRDVGFDSLAAVELRNGLTSETGLRLPVTLIFDYPTPRHVIDLIVASFAKGDSEKSPQSLPDPSGTENPQVVVAAPKSCNMPVSPVVPGPNDDPIVVVSMGCRLPGGVRDLDSFWQMLAEGRDVVGDFPDNRGWEIDALYDPKPGIPGKTYTRSGAFLYDADEFDPSLFGIGEYEALAMDPQQRLLLEVAWETIERAGLDASVLRGSSTGVWAGVMHHDYGTQTSRVPAAVASFLGNGNSASILTGRVAYTLGLEGPAISVDTACSSSLVALHQACQALRGGEVDLALAGGVTVMSTPSLFVEFSQQKGMAPDGRCKSYAESADGTGWSEGVALVMVARLSTARRQGLPIQAVIKATAVNSDGASNGLTAPNGLSQQRVIRSALERAGLDPGAIDLMEGHGTGTVLGDPIEVNALLACYGSGRPIDTPLWLGSVKSNLGHAQAAAGIIGLQKVILSMQHAMMPQTLHVDAPSSRVDWKSGGVRLLTQARPWPVVGRPRRAAVSSFGLSGTNAHVIVEEAPESDATRFASGSDRKLPLVLSAMGPAALKRQAASLLKNLPINDQAGPSSLARASLITRMALPTRAVVRADSMDELRIGLEAVVAGREHDGVWVNSLHGMPRVALMLPNSLPASSVLAELRRGEPVYDSALSEVISHLSPVLAREIAAVFGGGIPDTDHTDPAMAVLAHGLGIVRLLEAWGIVPQGVVGVGISEILAAHVTGSLSISGMISLATLACSSGADRNDLMDLLADMNPLQPRDIWISSSNGRRVGPEVGDAAFWSDALGSPREGRPGELVESLKGARIKYLLPLDRLGAEVAAGLAGDDLSIVAADVPFDEPPVKALRELVARLWALGADVNRVALAGDGPCAELPTYDFARRKYWLKSDQASSRFQRVPGIHPLLETVIIAPSGDRCTATAMLSEEFQPWLTDHVLRGKVVLPGSAYVELAMALGECVGAARVAELVQLVPLEVPSQGSALHLELVRDGVSWRFYAHARPKGSDCSWVLHAEGRLEVSHELPKTMIDEAGAVVLSVDELYPLLAEHGFGYGVSFQCVRQLWQVGEGLLVELELPQSVNPEGFKIHPALLDAAMHGSALTDGGDDQSLPFLWRGVQVVGPVGRTLRCNIAHADGTMSIEGYSDDGRCVLQVEAVVTRPVPAGQSSLCALRWVPATTGEAGAEQPVVELPVPPSDAGSLVERTYQAVHGTLALVQAAAGQGDQMVLVCHGAMMVRDDEEVDPAAAAAWGVVRAAQAEHPGLFTLIDSPCDVALSQVLGFSYEEIAIRGEEVLIPELVATHTSTNTEARVTGPVLVTGATGHLGGPLLKHLARAHHVRHMQLLVRSETMNPDAAAVVELLRSEGVKIEVAKVDITDVEEVARALAAFSSLPRTVVHAAGTMDNALLGQLSDEQVDKVLAPKVKGAMALHEATLGLEIDDFICYSSIGGMLLPAGQANYAAANTFLDAFAAWRRQQGLPARSIVWGLWEGTSGEGSPLSHVDLKRMIRSGVRPLSMSAGLGLFDLAVAHEEAVLVAVDLDWDAARAAAHVPAVVANPTRKEARHVAAAALAPAQSVGKRLAQLRGEARREALEDLIRDQTAIVLGLGSGQDVPFDRGFTEMGIDSLGAVELRNRIQSQVGHALPATMIYDLPTVLELTDHLAELLGADGQPAQKSAHMAPHEERPKPVEDFESMDAEALIAAAMEGHKLSRKGPDDA